MARKLFCQICPLTYQISVWKGRAARRARDRFSGQHFAKEPGQPPCPSPSINTAR